MLNIVLNLAGVTSAADKAARISKYRRDVSRLASTANKRIERLERNGLTDSPAYQQYLKSGGGKFGVKGKDFNQVQSELSRMNRFINSETSTVKGVNKTLKEMASNTGIKYNNLKELRSKASKFFELASKAEQYLRNVADMASAVGYQKIWEAINTYTQKANVDLANSKMDIDQMLDAITNSLIEYEKPEEADTSNWFTLK